MSTSSLYGTATGKDCRKVRHSWIVASLCLALGFLVLPVHGAGESPPASTAPLTTLVPQLGSASEPERTAAITALVKMGLVSLKPVLDGFPAGSATYRKAAITVIAGLKQDKGYTALIDLVLTESNPEVWASAIDLLRLSASTAVRQRLIELLLSADPKVSASAAEIARAVNYSRFVDDLLRMLEKQLQEKKRRSGGMNVNLNSTDHKGYDEFSSDYVVGGKKVRQTIKMPVFKSVKADTVMALPAAKALVTLTGQDYGASVKKWQRWWKKSKKTLPKSGSPPPKSPPSGR